MTKKHEESEMKNEEQLTRRDFLKASGAVIISAALFNSLTGCSTNTDTVTIIEPTTKTATITATTTKTLPFQEMTVVSDIEFGTGSVAPGGFGGAGRGSPSPMIYEGLVAEDINHERIPSLAESWEVSADGLQWTFYLKKGVKFHDGSDFTSADVKFTADWNGKYGSKMYWGNYVRVDCPDDYTAIIVFSKPEFIFDFKLTIISNYIMSKNTPLNEKGAVTQAIGTGHFKLVSITPAEEVILERNDEYWGTKAKLQRVTVKVITNPETQALALNSGQVDAIQCYLKVGLVPGLKTNPELTMSSILANNGGCLMMNPARTPFDDISVRKAINHAIDRDTIANTLLNGCANKTEYMLSLGFGKYVNKDVKNYSYDVDLAKQLLADAGWEDTNNDGFLEKDGTTLAIEINFDANTTDYPRIAEYLQSEFAKIGMKVTLGPQEYALLEKTRTSGNYDAILLYIPSIPHDEPAAHYEGVYSSWSTSYHLLNDTEIDDLVQQLNNTGDLQERLSLHYQLQKIIMEQSAVAYIYNYNSYTFAKKSVHNVQAAVHSAQVWEFLNRAYIE